MSPLNHVMERFKSKPTDIVGIDVGSTATKVVRLQKHGKDITLVAAAILPAVTFPAPDAPEGVAPLVLPPPVRGKYSCLAVTAENAVVKVLTFPGHFDGKAEERIVESMGIEHADEYRIGYKVTSEGHGRSEARVLTVAIPDAYARLVPQLLPSGLPVPFSLEVSGLASLSAFLHAVPDMEADQAVGVIEFGATVTTLALFNKGVLALIRRLSVGTRNLLDKVRERMGVDEQTAKSIIADGSFDISQPVNEVLEPLVKQLGVSRDFVERRENCHVTRMYVSGGLSLATSAVDEMRNFMDVEVIRWNPLENLKLAKGAIPEPLSGLEWQLAGAVGACLATFEET